MRLVAKIGVFALALMLSAVPTMACLLPITTMTAAEHECCKQMAGQCGQAGMPSSHSCCRRLSGPEDSFVKASNVQLNHLVSIGATYFYNANASLLNENPLVHASLDFAVHGPPGSPPTTISVLRI